jgi:MoaA/NifB/PqqE/SkfB family radical SAM enzyme
MIASAGASLARLKALVRFPNAIAGHVDRVEGGNTIVGWAANLSAPGQRVVVECVRNGRVLTTAVANEPREDVRQAGFGDGLCGFRVTPPIDLLTDADNPTVRLRVQDTRQYLGPSAIRLQTDVFLWLVAADIVNNCNLRCPFCLYDYSSVTKTQVMSEETFRKLVRLLPAVPAGQFYISCLHEPTLHPRLNDLLAMIPEDQRHKVFFTTNLARPMKVADFEAWARSGLHHINISLDTLDPTRFAYLRKFGRFEVFKSNLDLLAETFRRMPGAPKLRYITMAFKSNFDEIPDVVNVSRERWLSSENEIRYTFNVAHVTDDFRKREYLFKDDWDTLTQRLEDTGAPYLISYPPQDAYEETIKPAQNFFESREQADDQTRATFTRPMGLRVASDGTVLIVDAEDALRINLNSLEDPLHFFRSLLRQSRPRPDGATMSV